MKLTADTNVLVRAIVQDDARQCKAAQAALAKAEVVAVAIPALCEFAWVLSRAYGFSHLTIAERIRRLLDGANVLVNRPAAEAGLAFLDANGDFADGVIAHEGAWLGADEFVTFDKLAVRIVEAQGGSAKLL